MKKEKKKVEHQQDEKVKEACKVSDETVSGDVPVDETVSEDISTEQHDRETVLKNEIDKLKDNILRTMAEFDNFRKRSIKEKDKCYADALAKVLEQWLPLVDNLERAEKTIEELGDLGEKAAPVADGIRMICRQSEEILKKLDVEEIPALGEQFNPDFHNAIMQVEIEGHKPDEIVEVFQKGYKSGDRVLRHSVVKVAN